MLIDAIIISKHAALNRCEMETTWVEKLRDGEEQRNPFLPGHSVYGDYNATFSNL